MVKDRKPIDPIYSRMLDILREYVFKVQPGAKITQNDIAEYFNTTQNNVSTWKSKGPSLSPLKKLANEFNISLDWLILGKGAKLSTIPTETVQDMARTLSKLVTITDMHIEQCTQDGPEIKEDERNYNGIQITLFPRREIFYANDSLSSAISRPSALRNNSENNSLIPMDQVITIEDNRGDLLLGFLRRFTRDLEEYENSIYSRVDYDINSRVDLLISSLPSLSIAPIPDNLNKDELYQYPFTPAESKEIPWFIVKNNSI